MALLNRRRALRGPGGFAVVQYLRAVPLLASVGMIELLPWLADAVLESKTGEDSPARWLRCG